MKVNLKIQILLIIVVLAILFVFKLSPDNTSPKICKNCNVIIISLDTVSSRNLPCYGYKKNTAPNLCKFANENILFKNSFSQSNFTLASTFSVFTSQYPSTHTIQDVNTSNPLDEKYITLAQLFRLNGYQTIYHGELNDPNLPLNRGLERGFNIFEGTSDIKTWDNAYKTFSREAEKRPTFMFLHTYAVHEPYLTGHKKKHPFTDIPEIPHIPLTAKEYNKLPPGYKQYVINIVEKYYPNNDSTQKIIQKLRNAKDTPEVQDIFSTIPFNDSAYLSFNNWPIPKIDKNNPQEIEYLRALYDEQIYNLDTELVRLFDLIKDQKFYNNTILIISGVHGEEFMEHGFLYHVATIYRPVVSVPLIMYIPGVKAKKINELVQGIDIYPTILSLTGIKSKSILEGIDLSGQILNLKNPKKNKYVKSERVGHAGNLVGVQVDDWTLYFRDIKQQPTELYNLSNDKEEQNNLIKKYPEKVREIINIIK